MTKYIQSVSRRVRRASKKVRKHKAVTLIFLDWALHEGLDWTKEVVKDIFSGSWNGLAALPGVALLLVGGAVILEALSSGGDSEKLCPSLLAGLGHIYA